MDIQTLYKDLSNQVTSVNNTIIQNFKNAEPELLELFNTQKLHSNYIDKLNLKEKVKEILQIADIDSFELDKTLSKKDIVVLKNNEFSIFLSPQAYSNSVAFAVKETHKDSTFASIVLEKGILLDKISTNNSEKNTRKLIADQSVPLSIIQKTPEIEIFENIYNKNYASKDVKDMVELLVNNNQNADLNIFVQQNLTLRAASENKPSITLKNTL